MSPKKSSPLAIRTLCFTTPMRASSFRIIIESAILRGAAYSDSFIVGVDPSFFRIMGMDQHGDILMSHCKFADPIGIRLSFRFRQGDFAIIDRIIVALGLDIEPAPCMGKGSLMPFEDRSVGHMLLDLADKLPTDRLQVLPTAIGSLSAGHGYPLPRSDPAFASSDASPFRRWSDRPAPALRPRSVYLWVHRRVGG